MDRLSQGWPARHRSQPRRPWKHLLKKGVPCGPIDEVERAAFAAQEKKKRVVVNDRMQRGYVYSPDRARGQEFRSRVQAAAHALGAAQDRRLRREIHDRLPRRVPGRVVRAREALRRAPRTRAEFLQGQRIAAPQSWRAKGWIHPDDPRGWFQWYCRYYMGRRAPDDARQIRRWKNIRRHLAQIEKHCARRDLRAARASASRSCTGPTTRARSSGIWNPRDYQAMDVRTRILEAALRLLGEGGAQQSPSRA